LHCSANGNESARDVGVNAVNSNTARNLRSGLVLAVASGGAYSEC